MVANQNNETSRITKDLICSSKEENTFSFLLATKDGRWPNNISSQKSFIKIMKFENQHNSDLNKITEMTNVSEKIGFLKDYEIDMLLKKIVARSHLTDRIILYSMYVICSICTPFKRIKPYLLFWPKKKAS